MRYLLLSVLVVCIIGFFAIPQAFADPLQEKLDEYWNCAIGATNNRDCVKVDEKHIVGISPTVVADYWIEKDGTLTFTYEDPNISKKLEKFRDQRLHQHLWDIYTSITPKQILSEVVYFVVYTDDYGVGESASVGRDPDNPLKFDLFVDPTDMVPSGIKIDKQFYVSTLIHENAHILSLGANQGDNNVPPYDATPAEIKQFMNMHQNPLSCANYYNDIAGCMNENSYLNAFFQKFWNKPVDETNWIPNNEHKWEWEFSDRESFLKHNEDFHWKFKEHWITDYASENPDEDFAESFMTFVLKEPSTSGKCAMKPTTSQYSAVPVYDADGKLLHVKRIVNPPQGPQFCDCEQRVVGSGGQSFTASFPPGCGTATLTIQDQKKNFFYQYDELKEMRSFIRNAIATSEFCDSGTVWNGKTCVKPVSSPPQQQTQQQSKGSGCLIATAAFGSEMAPQVQLLREIRDNTVLQTESGTSFMTGFNQFYYSFSPAVADYERENPAFKEAVKITLTPLLTSLTLLQYADIDSESEMLGYGIGVILLNIGMYFVAPAILIMTVRKRI